MPAKLTTTIKNIMSIPSPSNAELVRQSVSKSKITFGSSTDPPPGRENAEKGHNAGKVLIGPTDNYVYVGVGDVIGHRGQAQNVLDGAPLDGTSGILRVTQDRQSPTQILH